MRKTAIIFFMAALLGGLTGVVSAQPVLPLTTLDYRVTGTQLTITPSALAVPKGIAGSVATRLPGEVPAGAYVEATLRGPSFPARRLVGAPNQPLLLPPLNVVGDYSLDGIRLADGTTNATLLDGTPPTVPVQVFDEVLVSRVTSKQLTLQEIQERGIVIDESNFRAVEFEVGFVLDGQTIPIRFPVVTPQFRQTTEIIPAAELEERLAEAERINDTLAANTVFPPELEVALPNISVRPLNVQFTSGFSEDLGLSVPPIPALMVIPGNIGFLNQFFSVQIFTENAAPANSGLSVHSLTAELLLPAGPDRVPGTNAQPGDDPVRFARTGPNADIRSIIPLRTAGTDGKSGTPDDADRLQPGDTGLGEFLVEGLQEGLHVMDLKLKAKLDGLAAGTVEVEGKAAGSVQVSNPKFSMAFSHPRTIRAGESYDAHITLLNTSQSVANLVSISLNPLNISGGVLQSAERVEFPTLRPGETVTATFRILSQRTGDITFSNITTSDDSLVGRLRLRGGVDERGVQLSRNTLLLPDFVNELPDSVVSAAQRVLGQALSVSTAPQLPPGLLRVPNSFVKTMAIQLAEAGQRARYGESLPRVLADLLLDWQGARDFSAGWDQIIRTTEAGREWREALLCEMENAVPAANLVRRLTDRAVDFAGRGQDWLFAAVSRGSFDGVGDGSSLSLTLPGGVADTRTSSLEKAAGYGGCAGAWLASRTAAVVQWKPGLTLPGETQVSVLRIAANGTGRELLWRLIDFPAGGCVSYDAAGAGTELSVDENCDGTPERTVAAQVTDFTEAAPELLLVQQDPVLLVGRPLKTCYPLTTKNDRNETVGVWNYANVVALLFSKPVTQDSASNAAAYTFGGGNEAAFVQVQPGGRVALMTLRRPIGALTARSLSTLPGIMDARGLALVPVTKQVRTQLREGISARGRVIKGDGSGAAGVPVTLTYNDAVASTFGCAANDVRVAQVLTGPDGSFAFEFILTGIPFSLSATNTEGLSAEALAAIQAASLGGRVDGSELLALAGGSAAARDALLEAFGSGSLPQAIAAAEGLDRALVKDFAAPSRQSSEGVYALTFRGRATVTGTVFAADGTTPVGGAAVNLFPDPTSRELGRGLLAGSDGRFAFFGVPLGLTSVEATGPTGRTRIVSTLIEGAGTVHNLNIVLSADATVRTGVQGRVTEPDGSPHGAARVYVQVGSAVAAMVTADDQGYFTATEVPVGNADVVALSVDGRRGGERRGVSLAAGAVNTVNVSLQARATVSGRVEFANGDPVAGALVGGGEALVTTDSVGRFTLTGVPTGPARNIIAGLAANESAIDPRRHLARTGGASLNVQPGDGNFVVVRFNAAGRIAGQVLDEAGNPVPNTDVAIPLLDSEELSSFAWVDTDAQGRFLFDNMAPGTYDLSTPSPPHDSFDAQAALSQLRSGDRQQMEAAINAAFAAFVGINDPLLNGEGANFRPDQWGFTRDVRLEFDGQTVTVPVKYLPRARISGVVKNGQGVPIGARVRLTGIAPKPNGRPTMRIRADLDSDPALGTFLFRNEAFIGDWGLQAASPFFPVVVSASGRTTQVNPVAENIVLQFPSVRETNGSLSGQVVNADGTPAGADIKVQISFGPDFVIRTNASGRFATTQGTFTLPAGGYTVTATDDATGAKGQASAHVSAGQDNQVTVRLLGRGAARVLVRKADGTPAAGATVEIQGGSFPGERFDGVADAGGSVVFSNVFEGTYAACASLTTGGTRLAGRSGFSVSFNSTSETAITLGGTGTVRGTFVRTDGVTPVPFATVALGSGLAVSPTDAAGRFEMTDVPLGTHRLAASDAVTGRSGFASVTLALVNEVREVRVVETALGSVFGLVINGLGTGPLPGAEVRLDLDDPFMPNRTRTVTAGPDGAYEFAGVPAGTFRLSARDVVSGRSATVAAALGASGGSLEVNLLLTATANLMVQVFEPDGTTPATNATVTMSGFTADTDAQGRVRFENVTVRSSGSYTVVASSRTVGQTRSFAAAQVSIAVRGAEETAVLTLRGTGAVQGRVLLSDGITAAGGAEVIMEIAASGAVTSPFAGQRTTVIAGGDGSFSFGNLPAGTVKLSATTLALGAQADAVIVRDQTTTQDLTLSASGTVTGRLVRANGTTPAEGADVGIIFTSATGAVGNFLVRTGADGRFSFTPVRVGAFTLSGSLPTVNGIVTRTGTLTGNGGIFDAGDIVLDEALPVVVSTVPANTAVDADINAGITVLFSEAMRPASIDPTGIFVRRASGGPPLPATVTLVAPPGETALRQAVISPAAPLESEVAYQIVVVDGDLIGATGGVIHRGPRDLEGRILPALFSATFTTRDQRPPLLLSFTPASAAEQVDVTSVVRLSFDEPIASGATITLTGSGGTVAGATSLGLNSLALTFVPAVNLPPNEVFTVTVNGVQDLAGNALAGLPLTRSFATTDTLGPVLSALRLKNNAAPVAGSNVILEAVPAALESNIRVRFTANFNTLGTTADNGLEFPFTLPSQGTLIFGAIAIDRFGNEGPLRELTVAVQENTPPVITFTRLNPLTGPVASGSPFAVRVNVTDDGAVTDFRAAATGGGTVPLQSNTTGAPLFIQAVLPPTAVPGGKITMVAQATDNSGRSSGEQRFELDIADGTPPTVSIVSPPPDLEILEARYGANGVFRDVRSIVIANVRNGAVDLPVNNSSMGGDPIFGVFKALIVRYRTGGVTQDATVPEGGTLRITGVPQVLPAGQPLLLEVETTDNSGDVTLQVTLAGGVTGTQTVNVDGTPNVPKRTLVTLDLSSAPAAGGALTVNVRAVDAAGREALTSAVFTLPDSRPPVFTGAAPVSGALRQSLWTDLVLTFDEAMKPDSFTPANIEFPGAFAVTASAGNTVLTLRAAAALAPGQLQSVRLKPGLTDAAGNPWQDTGGAAVPAEGKLITFTTASFTPVNPAPDAKVVPGQTITARADFEAGLGADEIVFTTLSAEAVQSVNGSTSTTASASFKFPLTTTPGDSFFIIARKSGRPSHTLPAIPLDVRLRSADDDGDGILNGIEADAGTDPFFDDRTLDPDSDGLSNAGEFLAGTNPNDPDSDDDLLNDGAEVAAGTNPLDTDTDDDLLIDGREGSFGTSPKLADTDGDTLTDGFEVGFGRISTVPGSFTWLEARADAATRGGHLMTILTAQENSAMLLVNPTIGSTGFWIGFTDRFIEGHFRWETGETGAFTNFNAGQPDNSLDEDFVHFHTADARWNDNAATARLGYVLERGSFTNPALPDTDSDGVRDDADAFQDPVNRPPLPGVDAFTTNAGEARLIPAGALLNNDTEPDNDPFIIVAVSQAANGTVVLENNGSQVRYTPNNGFAGTDSFTYTLVDAGGLTAAGTVNITVGSNHAPVAGTLLSYENRALQFDGSDDSATGPQLPGITDNFTFELWVNPSRPRASTGETSSGASGQFVGEFAVFPTHGANLGGDPHAGAGLSVGTNGFVVVEHAASYFPTPLVFDATVSDWTHVAVVYENKRPSLYVNGVLVRTGLVSPRIVHPGTDLSIALGRFRGGMDEYRVWNFARTGAEIAADFGRRLSGGEPGLAAYWRMDESGGTALVDSSPAGRSGTLAGGVVRVTPGAPLVTRGQIISVIKDTMTPIVLAGSDEDGGVPGGRINSLPQDGKLFQRAAGGGPGVEITSVPAVVSDGGRRVFYQPDPGFLGEDAFIFSVHDSLEESAPALALVRVIEAFPTLSDDLWDVSQGVTVTGSSGFHPQSSGENMFGGSSGVEPGNAIFADGRPAGFTHFVEWESASFLRLEGARVFATQGGDTIGQRTFTEMRLFGRVDSAPAFTLLATFRPGENPYPAPVRAVLSFAPFVGNQFRAEFDQFGNFAFPGPRIEELDAIGETVVMVPTPVNVTLQNATSDRCQGAFNTAQLIDGIVAGGAHGWAGDVGGTPPMTAVFETAQNIQATPDTEFVFELPQPFGGQHFVGNFRLSATTDPRSAFADGLINGGDITANWTILDPLEVTTTGGETVTVLPDQSILIGGTMPATTSYTVRAKGISGGVTGFRLELLEHPSLPNNGPGRVGHGNWVLAELTVRQAGAINVPNRAPQGVADSAQTPQGIPVTTGNVLANDTDPEGDTISLLDFTQPATGTGSVLLNTGNTFTWTPPNGTFIGAVTFTYRITDSRQNSRPVTVTINVVPSPERIWTNAAGGNWNNAANWLGGNIPGPDDVAVIDLNGTYTVNLDTSPTVSQLRLGGAAGTQTLQVNGRTLTVRHAGIVEPNGTLVVTGDGRLTMPAGTAMTVTGTLNFDGGTLTAGGRIVVDAGATANLTGGAGKFIDGVLENRGTVNYTGSGLLFGRDGGNLSARIENAAGGTFIVDGEGDFAQNFSSPNYRIENAGTFIKRGAGTTTVINSPLLFASTGTVEVESGVLQFNTSTSLAGTLSGAGAVVFAGGTHALPAGMTFSPAVLSLSNVSLSFGAGVAPQLTVLDINASTVNFAESRTLLNLTIRGDGRLTMPAGTAMTVSGTLNFDGGTLTAGGRLVVDAGATANLTGGAGKFIDGVLENRGTVNYTGSGLLFGRDGGGLSARIENAAGGTFIVNGEGDFAQNFSSPNYRIENAGTFIKRGAGTTTVINNPLIFASTGTVEIESGVLLFNNSTSLAGTLTGAGTVMFAGGTHALAAGMTFTPAVLSLSSVSLSIGAGVAPQLAVLDINASTVSFAESRTLQDLTIRGDGRLTMPAGTAMMVSGTLNFDGGTLTAGGRLVVDAGATANLTGGAGKFIDGVLENRGTVNYTGSGLLFGRDGGGLSARIENAAGGTFIVNGEGDFAQNFSSPNYRIENAGNFIKGGAGTTTVINSPINFTTTGTISMEAGSLQVTNDFTNGGTLFGNGTVIANVISTGTVRTRSTPGGLTIQGNYTQTAAGRLELSLAGNDLILGHRNFRVTGSAAFAGAFDLKLDTPFAEPLNAVLSVLSFGSRTGDFNAVTGLADNFGYTFSRAFTASTLDLTVTTVGSLPPPPDALTFGFAHWMAEAAAQAGADNLTGRDDDPDGDGASNFMEYAFGTRPFAAASLPVLEPFLVEIAGAVVPAVSFHFRCDDPSLGFVVEESSDLLGWSVVEHAVEASRCPLPGLLHEIQMALPEAPPPGRATYLRIRLREK